MKKIEPIQAHLITDKEPNYTCSKLQWFYFNIQFTAKKNLMVKVTIFSVHKNFELYQNSSRSPKC